MDIRDKATETTKTKKRKKTTRTESIKKYMGTKSSSWKILIKNYKCPHWCKKNNQWLKSDRLEAETGGLILAAKDWQTL